MSLTLYITFGSVTTVGQLITKTTVEVVTSQRTVEVATSQRTVEVVTSERTVATILGKSGNDLVKIQQLSWYKEA